jgi:hypothetical protein
MVDEALNKLHADYDKQRADMLRHHQEELAALQVTEEIFYNYLKVFELVLCDVGLRESVYKTLLHSCCTTVGAS